MAATVRAQPGTGVGGADAPRPAGVLVIFGITGDLAKVMTFARSTGSSGGAS